MKCCICGTIKNCAEHLDKVFKNIKKISKLFEKYVIILYYDDSTDNTLEKIMEYKKKIKIHLIHNTTYKSDYRTHRLAYGRNYCLKIIRKKYSHYDYFIMMDFDDVCSNEINISVLENSLKRNDWQALSFNKTHYYDIWALSIRPYVFSFIHFNNPVEVLHNMTQYITEELNKLSKNELLRCISAFNGFSIYKTNVFIDCSYNGNVCLDLIPNIYIKENINTNNSPIVFKKQDWLSIQNEDCEHRSFHLSAIIKNNAIICISPDILF